MLFDGQTIKVDTRDGGLAELGFERGVEAVNKPDALIRNLIVGDPHRHART